ncbi:MAG TPA: cupin domain-containing protein [Anaerolineae bacterium]|nr:cupin domain-containing protein [Anaerolineae bacterium]HPL29220.1 cupin domain-containing protein [Anaerolineae bacterium]
MSSVRRYLISKDEVQPLDVGDEEGFRGVDSRLIVSDETMGSGRACLFRVIFPKGAYHGPHLHTESDELLYALRGKAIQWVDGVEYIMTAGTAMLIPKNVVHWMRNDWNEEFEVIGVYPEVPNFSKTGQQVPSHWERFGFTSRPSGE